VTMMFRAETARLSTALLDWRRSVSRLTPYIMIEFMPMGVSVRPKFRNLRWVLTS
jgi:hypothetical protein